MSSEKPYGTRAIEENQLESWPNPASDRPYSRQFRYSRVHLSVSAVGVSRFCADQDPLPAARSDRRTQISQALHQWVP